MFLRIAFVGPFGLHQKGTMSVRALPMAKALVARGHQVTMIIPPWDEPEYAKQSWVDEGVNIVHVALPMGVPGLYHLELTRRLVAEVRRFQPQVVHFFKPKAYSGLAHTALWALRGLHLFKAKLVVDTDDWEQAWNEVAKYTPAQKRVFVWQEEWGLRFADVVTVASRTLERLVTVERRNLGGQSQQKVIYLPNGFHHDTPTSHEMAQELRQHYQLDDAPVILLYSRFAEFRLSRITHFVQTVAEAMPEARWLVVGQGFYGEERNLERKLNEAGLSEYVRFAGWVQPEKIPAYFQVAQVAIFPYDDTLINRTKCSVKLIELLAAGLPVVADAIGQNLEYIQDKQSGILVPMENDVAFSQALIELLANPQRQQKLGQAAQRAMTAQFSWSKLVKKLERAYDLA